MKKQERENPALALLHERLEGTMRIIGLTGGIASGKSTVAAFFKGHKIPVIDADEIARNVVQPKKPAYQKIVETFGKGVLLPDGKLDREKLGQIVFSDESKRKLLESITHPEIFREIGWKVAALKKKKTVMAIVDAALLFESELHHQMHKNILVRLHPDIQLKRLMVRNKLSEKEAWPRILSQMPTPEKEKFSDFVIDNSGSLEETRDQVRRLIVILRK
jgi:dephospho-CoA kinase